MKILAATALVFLAACGVESGNETADTKSSGVSATALHEVPAWTKDVVWYQIFVERFRDGDPSNDPTLADIEGSWPHLQPDGWKPAEWTADWYEQEPWAAALDEEHLPPLLGLELP